MILSKRMYGFIGASLSLLLLFSASASPIPLYGHYAELLGMDKGALSLTSVMYFVGTLIALVFFGRLSNHWGRKRTIYMTLALGIAGCMLFIFASSTFMVMLGRFVQGISCGMASNTVMAYVVDTEPQGSGFGAAVAGAGPNLGLSIGAVGTGICSYFGSQSFVFELSIVLLLLCSLFICKGNETIALRAGALKSLCPVITVPDNIKRMLIPAGCTFFAGWSVGGFYQSYSAGIAAQIFGLSDTAVASLVFVSFIAPVSLGVALGKKLPADKAQPYGITSFVISLVLLYASLFSGSIIVFFAVNVLAGITQGIMFIGSMASILNITTIENRAGVLSVIYIMSYCGAAVPNLVVSKVAYLFDLIELTLGYVILGGICWIVLFGYKYLNKKSA